MIFRLFIILSFPFLLFGSFQGNSQTHKKVLKLMGSRFEIIVVHPDAVFAEKAIADAINEIKRIENLISSWDPNSQTSAINRNAGIKAINVDRELYDLIYRSKKVSALTEGIFDISFASIDKIWRFDGTMKKMPDASEMLKSVELINYNDIILNSDSITVFLKNKGMKIGFGGIGKGYAANRARDVLKRIGIENGVVNASGDLIAWGRQEDGEEWGIGITDPKNKEKAVGWIRISDLAVVTSGNYEKFVEFNGKRYSHIINPKTGMPASGTKSVTLICPDAELADALATSVFILGEKKGIALIDKLKNIECLLITDDDRIVTSKNMALYYK